MREENHRLRQENQALRDEVAQGAKGQAVDWALAAQPESAIEAAWAWGDVTGPGLRARQIGRMEVVKAKGVPEGSRFKGYSITTYRNS